MRHAPGSGRFGLDGPRTGMAARQALAAGTVPLILARTR